MNRTRTWRVDLPYPPRPGQLGLKDAVEQVQAQGRHGVLEAATGTGKTIAVLSASLGTAVRDDRRIVYLTRTNSQQTQVVREHAALVEAGADPGLLVPFMGRRQYCPLLADDERFRDGTPEELGKLCSDAKKKARQAHETGKPVPGACGYYETLLRDGTGPIEALLTRGGLDGPALAERIRGCGSCPYEALKATLPKARTVTVPYIYLLDARLREAFLQWLGTGLDDVHVVIDEAHNLPEAARGHHSPRLSATTLKRAVREAEQYQDPVLAGRVLSTTLLHALTGVLFDIVHDHVVGDQDGRVPPGALEQGLMERLRVPSTMLARIAADLETWGEVIREERRQNGKLPRSHLGAVGTFLYLWQATQEGDYAHLVTGGDNPAIEAYLLDPAPVLSWLHEAASTTHISGTLAPPEEHVALCGLPPDTTTRCFDSPFEEGRLRVVAIEGLHRRWAQHQEDPEHGHRQQEAARAILKAIPGKTGLFFPSHAMLQAYVEEGFLHGVDRAAYQEEAGMDTPAMMRMLDRFRRDKDPSALLLAVLGGRITEGMDFPGDTMCNAILFGIPYPKPSARSQALIDHADRKHGHGWTYAVHNPVGRVLRQAIGRLVRGPEDRGVAIILDERAMRFYGHLKRLEMAASTEAALETIAGPAPATAAGFVTATTLQPVRRNTK